MNRPLLLLFILLSCLVAHSQTGYLFIKKGGKKKRAYTEGDRIHFLMQNGFHQKGIITLLRNDTIFLNGNPIPRKDVMAVILDERKKKPFPADKTTMLMIGGGVGLTALGLSLNDANPPGKAIIAAVVIGYGPLLIKHLFGRLVYTIHRKKFRMGKKFRLQVLDFYLPQRRSF